MSNTPSTAPRKLSWQYHNIARRIRCASPATKLVLLHLGASANDNGESWHGIPSISVYCEISPRQVHRCLQTLKALGLVTWTSGGGRTVTNRYKLNLKAMQELVKTQGIFDDRGRIIRDENGDTVSRFPKKAKKKTVTSETENPDTMSRFLPKTLTPCHQNPDTMSRFLPKTLTPCHQNPDTMSPKPPVTPIQEQPPENAQGTNDESHEGLSVWNGDREPDESHPCPFCDSGRVYPIGDDDPSLGWEPHCGSDDCEAKWFASLRPKPRPIAKPPDTGHCKGCRQCPKGIGELCRECHSAHQVAAKFDAEEIQGEQAI